MNISLSPELERLIAEKLRSGRYHSVGEVVREGLELLREREVRPGNLKKSESLPDVFAAIARDVAETDWAHVPSDLSKNLEHYLYGSKKTS